MLIRSSGETRLSDFMLWQCGNSYLSFQEVLWPDFSLIDLAWSIVGYQKSHGALQRVRGRHTAAAAHILSEVRCLVCTMLACLRARVRVCLCQCLCVKECV